MKWHWFNENGFLRDDELEPEICQLCYRPIPPALREAHHLIPKSRGGTTTVPMHRVCHKQIHALFTETELARHYPTSEALRAHPEMARFIHWVQDKPSDFNPPIRRSRGKGQFLFVLCSCAIANAVAQRANCVHHDLADVSRFHEDLRVALVAHASGGARHDHVTVQSCRLSWAPSSARTDNPDRSARCS